MGDRRPGQLPAPTRADGTRPRRRAAAEDLPIALGAGERLFGETSDKKPMRLVTSQVVEGDVVFLTYEVVREA
jgi:hypothetical protein